MYGGIVYDALRLMGLSANEFLLAGDIRPLDKDSVIWGPIFTTRGGEVGPRNYKAHDEIRLDIYDNIKSEQIVMLESNDFQVAHSGDITSLLYKIYGAWGFVTDGIVRDSRKIIALDFPCFCTSTNPIDAIDYWAITDYDCDIRMDSIDGYNIDISPNDYVFGDADGVMIVKQAWLEEFYTTLVKVREKERIIREKIRSKMSVREVYEEMGRW